MVPMKWWNFPNENKTKHDVNRISFNNNQFEYTYYPE